MLATGQAGSGKLTVSAALALAIGGAGHPVTLLTDKTDDFVPFRPLPANWAEEWWRMNK